MHPADKFLKKLPNDKRRLIEGVLAYIRQGKFSGLDVKKLKGYSDVFRVRKGDVRIIFQMSRTALPDDTVILDIRWRNEGTYSDY